MHHRLKAIAESGNTGSCPPIGLTPQSINAFGGFKVQGKNLEAAAKKLN